jgi:hypothetical protein
MESFSHLDYICYISGFKENERIFGLFVFKENER